MKLCQMKMCQCQMKMCQCQISVNQCESNQDKSESSFCDSLYDASANALDESGKFQLNAKKPATTVHTRPVRIRKIPITDFRVTAGTPFYS